MEKEYVTITVEIDSELMRKANAVLEPLGLTLEQAFYLFLQWTVKHPDEAAALLLKWKEAQDAAEH